MEDHQKTNFKASDIMTRDVVSIRADTKLKEITEILSRYDYDGIPIVDTGGRLIGIITQYELVTKSSGLHIPTLMEFAQKLKTLKGEESIIKKRFDAINETRARDIMNDDPLTVSEHASVERVSRLFAEHHRVNPIPVINNAHLLVGIISRYDIIKLFNFQNFHHSIEAAEERTDHETAGQQALEQKTERALGLVGKKFVLVSSWRTRLWYIVAVAGFIVGFLASIALLIRFNEEPVYPEVKITYPEE